MDPFNNDRPMALSDARIILQHFLSFGTFHGDDCELIISADINFFYDQRFVYNEHDYYAQTIDRLNAVAFDPAFTDFDRAVDAEFVRDIGAWTCAMTTLNRALPVTLDHADECVNAIDFHIGTGFVIGLLADSHRTGHMVLTPPCPDCPTPNACEEAKYSHCAAGVPTPDYYEVRNWSEIWRNDHFFFTISAEQMAEDDEATLAKRLCAVLNLTPNFWS